MCVSHQFIIMDSLTKYALALTRGDELRMLRFKVELQWNRVFVDKDNKPLQDDVTFRNMPSEKSNLMEYLKEKRSVKLFGTKELLKKDGSRTGKRKIKVESEPPLNTHSEHMSRVSYICCDVYDDFKTHMIVLG